MKSETLYFFPTPQEARTFRRDMKHPRTKGLSGQLIGAA